MIDVNPLDALNERKMRFLPAHFTMLEISDTDLFNPTLESWIKQKLKGRYAITRVPRIDKTGKLRLTRVLGLEDQKEMTYFMLACPHLRR
jgi:hypothetical protein